MEKWQSCKDWSKSIKKLNGEEELKSETCTLTARYILSYQNIYRVYLIAFTMQRRFQCGKREGKEMSKESDRM